MSKKQQEKKSDDIPLDHMTEMKNLQYTIVLREGTISNLKLDNVQKSKLITSFETEVAELRLNLVNSFKSEKEARSLRSRVDTLERENEKLREDLLNCQFKFDEEKRQLKGEHLLELNRMNLAAENYHQKIEMVNQLIIDKDDLKNEVEKLKAEKEKISNDNVQALQRKEVANQNKFSNLKKKMMENINQTQSKVTELNIQFMDVSTKLTVLQNHQLFIQLEYQTQQIEELTRKKEALEKKVFELSKDIEIHKEVELSLAEKNKRLQQQELKKDSSEGGSEDNSHSNIMNNKLNSNNSNISDTYNNTREYMNILNLEKKVYNLERKLNQKSKEYNILKNSSEYVELRLKNYEKKYAGLFNFFEESLLKLFEDEEIKNNKEIYVNIESLQNGNFNCFSQKEKYSILVILMKYLLPLVTGTACSVKQSKMNNVGLKFQYSQRYLDDPELKKFFGNKVKKSLMQNNSYDSLPVIRKLGR